MNYLRTDFSVTVEFLKKVSYFTYSKTFAFVVEDCCYNGHFLAADNRVWEGQ